MVLAKPTEYKVVSKERTKLALASKKAPITLPLSLAQKKSPLKVHTHTLSLSLSLTHIQSCVYVSMYVCM
jgi:hypothetical protein